MDNISLSLVLTFPAGAPRAERKNRSNRRNIMGEIVYFAQMLSFYGNEVDILLIKMYNTFDKYILANIGTDKVGRMFLP